MRFVSRRGPDSRYSKPEILKKVKKSEHAEKVEKSKISNFSEMTPQGLRRVSVSQKTHKHDFPKLQNYEKRIFWKIEICLTKAA